MSMCSDSAVILGWSRCVVNPPPPLRARNDNVVGSANACVMGVPCVDPTPPMLVKADPTRREEPREASYTKLRHTALGILRNGTCRAPGRLNLGMGAWVSPPDQNPACLRNMVLS